MRLEQGTIKKIDARGRVTVELPDRVVSAELHSGSGGCIGDVIEGDMRPGVRSWRNVGTSVLSVVEVLGSEALPTPRSHAARQPGDPAPRRRAEDAPRFRADERWPLGRDVAPAGQYSNRRFN